MIDASDQTLYAQALDELRGFASEASTASREPYRGRFVQMFLGLKYWQQSVPSIQTGEHIASHVLEAMLDDLYTKVTRLPTECVAIIFDGSYIARSGLVVGGRTHSQNTWRNNFQLQKGIGCYADATELASTAFLNEKRLNCPHLVTTIAGSLRGATCALATAKPKYRGEDHRKWLGIDPNGQGFAVVDLLEVANFAPWVAPNGVRIPVLPLVVALYHDGDPAWLGARTAEFDLIDFAVDFNLAPAEFATYLDQDPANPHNAALLGGPWRLSYSPFTAAAVAPRPRTARVNPAARPVPTPVLTSTVIAPPVTTPWWDAEQAVADYLAGAGWTVFPVSRQQVGYDILAKLGTRTVFVEVKSSSGYCTPTLTSREWQQAKLLNARYVLAVLENFSPSGSNDIHWIPDPASSCVANPRSSVSYAIPRSTWTQATVASI